MPLQRLREGEGEAWEDGTLKFRTGAVGRVRGRLERDPWEEEEDGDGDGDGDGFCGVGTNRALLIPDEDSLPEDDRLPRLLLSPPGPLKFGDLQFP